MDQLQSIPAIAPAREPAPSGPLTTIIIVTFNQLDHTRRCLESLRRNTQPPYQLIVIDNASTDGTTEYLRDQATNGHLTLIVNPTNRGYPAAANQGLAQVTGDFVLLLNNDVVVPAGLLTRLQRPFAEIPELGLAGPYSNRVSGPQQIPVSYSNLNDLDSFAQQHAAAHAGQITFIRRLVGFCLLIRREVIDRIGLLDERFGIGNFEDDDYCRRAALAGFRAAIVGDAFVHHAGSASFAASDIDASALMRRNQRVFEEKWSTARIEPPQISVAQPQPLPVSTTNPNIKLSVCLIVRDSSATLAPCLQSIKPWVDEIIVVDTGSRDNTREIARDLGAKVLEFPWCDDFAAARNQSLQHAQGQWLFWMDSDDTIDEQNGRKLRELANRADHKAMAYVCQVHCPAAKDDSQYSTATVVDHVKLFRNLPGIRFTGRIHEQVLPAIRKLNGEVEWTDIFVIHSGSDVSPEGQKRKLTRDLRLLELELNDNPDSTFALFNFGMTLLHSGRPAEAISHLARSITLAFPGESHLRKVYALLAAAYAQLNRVETAHKTCLIGLNACPRDPELLFRKGLCEQTLGRWSEAEQTFRLLVEMPPSKHFSSINRGIVGVKAWHNLAGIYERLNKHESAGAAWRRVLAFSARNPAAWRGLLNSLSANRDIKGLEEIAAYPDDSGVSAEIRVIAKAYLHLAKGHIQAAANELNEAIKNGAAIEVLEEQCRLTFTAGLLPDAEHALTELSHRRPEDPSVFQNLASIQLRRGNPTAAALSAARSLELRPNHAPAKEILHEAQRLNSPLSPQS